MSNAATTWFIVADHAGAGILNVIPQGEHLRVLSRQQLLDDPGIRFAAQDKVCITSETVLELVLQRWDDPQRCHAVEQLKNKVSSRQLLQGMFPNLYFKPIKLSDLPTQQLDPSKKYFVKPVKGYWGSGGRMLQGKMDLSAVVRDIEQELTRKVSIFSDKVLSTEDFLIEEFIEGEEYAADMFFDAEGKPVITNICHHPIPDNKAYLHVVYYTTHEIYQDLHDKLVVFFTEMNKTLQAKSLPLHGEFRFYKDQFIPIELNPLRYGSDGLSDLSFHAFGLDPFACFANDIRPDWQKLWRGKESKVFAFYIGYNGTAVDVSQYRPDYRGFRALFSNIISDLALDYQHQLAFSVVYIEEDSVERIYELLNVEFSGFFIQKKKYSEASLRELYRCGVEMRIPAGTMIWREGDLGDYLLLILQGNIEAFVSDRDQREVVLDDLQAGSTLGELSALDGLPRSASARAKTDCVCIRIYAHVFRKLISRVPDILEDLFWQQVVRVREMDRKLVGKAP
ncbi:MAG: ATP-grasp domain-containing protein [Gammaproteobacteria bacterium]|nr:ATP-grasp domain-containing protein [Gammaproteobacteria bacterium]